MNLSRREMIARGTALLTAGAAMPLVAKADANAYWSARRRPVPATMTDVPSAYADANGAILQPQRAVPVYRTCDVLVVGGGIAGWAAAMAAAKAGRKTILAERDESLGGLWSNGGVLILLATGYMENKRFVQTTRGFTDVLMGRLEKMGHATTPRGGDDRMYLPTVDPEALKIALEQLLSEAGGEILYRCHCADVILNGDSLGGAVFETKEGRQAVVAKQVVDATGDGDVLFQAGEAYQQYRHGVGFTYRVSGFDSFPAGTTLGGGREPFSDTQWFNEFGVSPDGKPGVAADTFDIAGVSKILMHHRARAWRHVEDIRTHVKGCEKAHLVWTATQVGIRGARTLKGLRSLDRKWANGNGDTGDTVAWIGADGNTPRGARVPYGCLLPRKVRNLLVAGRITSCEDDMIDLVRLIAPCLVTGQAAGAAAALAASLGKSPQDVSVAEVQKLLLKQGAYLG